ncbi:reverse transcriptase domain-containing protein [Tanacetum coccineum]
MKEQAYNVSEGLNTLLERCTTKNFNECPTPIFQGTEEFQFNLVALTWWNSQVRTIGHDFAYAMTWTDLKKKMTNKYYPRSEIKKFKVELWNLKVKGTDSARLQSTFLEQGIIMCKIFSEESDRVLEIDAIEMVTELMDKKISTLAELQAKNKRKLNNNNQAQQQSPKRQNVHEQKKKKIKSTPLGLGLKKEYARLFHCATCKQHHQCHELLKALHVSDYPELKNQNHGNQAEGTEARYCGLVHALGGGEADQDLNDIEDDISA